MSERSYCNDTVLAERQALCERRDLTLNGKPARLFGAALRFPQVVDNETGLICEFSWVAVYNVIQNCNGEFRSY